MPRKKDDQAYLWDILESAETVKKFLHQKTFVDFQNDLLLKRAVERMLEIIGEAANHISKEFQENHPDIPWKRIIGQRHFLAHEYGEVLYERLWVVIQKDIPELILQLKNWLPNIPDNVDL